MNLPKKKINLTIDDIYARVSELELFKFYVPSFTELGKVFCSELRRDKNPSATIFMDKNGRIKYKDFADSRGNGDLTDYLKAAFMMNHNQIINKIAVDFGITEGTAKTEAIKKNLSEGAIKQKEYSLIQVSTQKLSPTDLNYWGAYLITKEELQKDDIFAIKEAWINRKKISIKKGELAFAYFYEDINRFKLYFPERDKGSKWISNLPLNYVEKLENLTSCEKGIITKSKKCRIVLSKLIPNVCNVQNESRSFLSPETCSFIRDNVKSVYLQFDSDRAGKEHSIALTKENNWNHLNVPDYLLKEGVKDFSDWVKSTGSLKEVEEFLKTKNIIS